MFNTKILIIIAYLFAIVNTSHNVEFCNVNDDLSEIDEHCRENKYLNNKRYILYDVNPLEGFNLRRDVYIRVAVFIKNLVESDKKYNWNLVLPPWPKLYHWRSQNIGNQNQLPWGLFFNIDSLKNYIPVIEMYEFIKEFKSNHSITILDKVYILNNDLEMFKTGKFEIKNEITDCQEHQINYKKQENYYVGNFWGYKNITAKELHCITFHGTTSDLKYNLNPAMYRSFIYIHMEIPLHDNYGSVDFWKARRSMRYNLELYDIANKYRKKYLDSTDEKDKTIRPSDWRNEKSQKNAVGGPYLSVHLRRRDFLTGRPDSVPTIKSVVSQLNIKMKQLGLEIIFIATDAQDTEFEELKEQLQEFKVYRYNPSEYVRKKFKDGGIAIIDQIICSHARYFIGTQESTFTFRIQEDREIIGFSTKTTFNMLCGKKGCDRNSQWEIVW